MKNRTQNDVRHIRPHPRVNSINGTAAADVTSKGVQSTHNYPHLTPPTNEQQSNFHRDIKSGRFGSLVRITNVVVYITMLLYVSGYSTPTQR